MARNRCRSPSQSRCRRPRRRCRRRRRCCRRRRRVCCRRYATTRCARQ
uniref:Sperm protamine P1 n=1 Tax=Cephalorhynchus commersonii TaxID=103582 RepID=F5CBC9_CEPCM|nr:protamine p1 [Cephalorhynchus commersonii]